MIKTKSGIHAAISGGRFPFVEKIVENRSINMKIAARTNPIARCTPLPPLALLLAMMAPMSVRMTTASGVANLR